MIALLTILMLGQVPAQVAVSDGNGGYVLAPAVLPATPQCVQHVLWSPCSPDGLSACTVTMGCAQTGKMPTSTTSYGALIPIDMNRWTKVRLVYFGGKSGAQTGNQSLIIRNYSDGTNLLTSQITTGNTCANRTGAQVDVTPLSGFKLLGLQFSNTANNNTPLLSSVILEACE